MLIVALLSTLSVAAASPGGITKKQLDLFDVQYVQAEKTACQSQTPGGLEPWVLGELKALGTSPVTEDTGQADSWRVSAAQLKVGDAAVEARGVRGTPGTYGRLAGQELKFSNDSTGQILSGPVLDAGHGTSEELNSIKNSKGAFWLVNPASEIPDLGILEVEAASRGALGLIVYGSPVPELAAGEIPAGMLIPTVTVSETSAKNILAEMKAGKAMASLSLKTDDTAVAPKSRVFVKYGARDLNLLVPARWDDCGQVATALGMIDWVKKSGAEVKGTAIGFVGGHDPAAAYPSALGKYVVSFQQPPETEIQKFIMEWIRADEKPESLLNLKEVMKKAEAVPASLKGLVDGDLLKKFGESLKTVSRVKGDQKLAVEAQLRSLFETDDLPGLATRIKALKVVHDLAQRGEWDAAMKAFTQIREFDWAGEVSESTFMDYSRRKFEADNTLIDPRIWVQMQKGKSNLDAVLRDLESEIDRLSKTLADNFFKLQKNLDSVAKI